MRFFGALRMMISQTHWRTCRRRTRRGDHDSLLQAQNQSRLALLRFACWAPPGGGQNGPFFIRVRDAANKYKWQKHETESAAKEAAELFPVSRQASELGLTVDEVTNTANANRRPIQTAIKDYLHDRRFGRPRSIAAYENIFDQLLANWLGGVRFINQLDTSRSLKTYVEFLRGQGYGNKTITIRMGFIFSLLKANGVE